MVPSFFLKKKENDLEFSFKRKGPDWSGDAMSGPHLHTEAGQKGNWTTGKGGGIYFENEQFSIWLVALRIAIEFFFLIFFMMK